MALLSRITEFVLVLPAIYVALSLRAVLPLVLSASTIFLLLTGIFTLLGWPVVARGVRAIVLAERERDYAMAARAAGMPVGPLALTDPFVTPDGDRIYFSSIRPVDGVQRADADLWMVQRSASGWSEPVHLGHRAEPRRAGLC